MKKNNYFKKYLLGLLIILGLFLGSIIYLNKLEYQRYNENVNNSLNMLIALIKEKYPNVSESEIISSLKNKEDYSNYLAKYGYDLSDNIILKNDNLKEKFLMIKLGDIAIFSFLILIIFIFYKRKNSKSIEAIIKKLEKINNGNYQINFKEAKEDELSLLKDEVAKTTIRLRSLTETSLNDKIKLKDYLEDISHQLKTPLTSICIMLDNLISNPDMEEEIREQFLNKIKREITNLNFLINSLLKLSKFEANAITFYEEEVMVGDLIKEAILNVNSLSDLKNVKINYSNKHQEKIVCDKKWQIEALTNILKNALEYSHPHGEIDIAVLKNDLYLEITIKDYGKGMDSKDLKHLFERFYKGKNASSDSIGIGLALAKSIIEKDNGKITCESVVNKGTTFKIKYFYS